MQNNKWGLAAGKKAVDLAPEAPDGDEVVLKKKTSRTTKRTRKKEVAETPDENLELEGTSYGESVDSIVSASSKDSSPRTRKKGISFCCMQVYFVLVVICFGKS